MATRLEVAFRPSVLGKVWSQGVWEDLCPYRLVLVLPCVDRMKVGDRECLPLGGFWGIQDNAGVCRPVLTCVPAGCLPVFYRLAKNQRLGGGSLPRQGIDCVKAWRCEGNGPLGLGFSCLPPNLLGLRPPVMG